MKIFTDPSTNENFLYVVDAGHHRVLRRKIISFGNYDTIQQVAGKSSGNSDLTTTNGKPNGLYRPYDCVVHSSGVVFVLEESSVNNGKAGRITEWKNGAGVRVIFFVLNCSFCFSKL